MTSIGSQASLWATHTYTHKDANVHTEIDKYTNSPARVMHIGLKQFKQSSQFKLTQCVFGWHITAAAEEINSTSLCHLQYLMCCHGRGISWLGNPVLLVLCQLSESWAVATKEVNLQDAIAANLRVLGSHSIIKSSSRCPGPFKKKGEKIWWVELSLHHRVFYSLQNTQRNNPDCNVKIRIHRG